MTAIPQGDLDHVMTGRQAMLWSEHHETLDWVVRKFRAHTPGDIRVTHDGERVLFVYRCLIRKEPREFIASVDTAAICTAPTPTIIEAMWRELMRSADRAYR